MLSYLLKEDGDALLQENGYFILLDAADAQYLWISDTSYEGGMRLDSFSFEECAEMGQVGTGGFDFDDSDLTMNVPALKSATYSDFRAASPRIFTGFTHTRTTEMGPMKVAGQRQWGVELLDINTLLDDDVMTLATADRPAETDRSRAVWLLNNVLVDYGVTFGVAPNTNLVTMDAVDYRGRKPRELLDQCGEISGKNYFLYADSAGIYLYYDLSTGTSLAATAKISDVATDVDSSTVWAPVGGVNVKRSPDEVYSTVHLLWSGGTVTVTNPTTAATYRTREINVMDQGVRTNTTAEAKANAFLAASSAERTFVSDLSVNVPAEYVNDFRAGYRIQIKLTRHGISSYTYYRIIRRVVRPAGDSRYVVTLSLLDTLAPTRYLYQRGSNEVWEVKSNATQDGASVIVNRDGITVTEGAITVQNANGVTIFDASGDGELTNDTGTVVINEDGITVTDGAIAIQDEFGKTTLGASGFSGSWNDFVKLGIYNARFADLTVGSITTGRTAALPYWLVAQTTGSPTFTGLSGGGVKITPDALNAKGTLTSDLVPVRPGASMEAGYAYKVNRAAGTLTLTGFVFWYQSDGSASSTPSTAFDQSVLTASVSTLLWAAAVVQVPDDATQAKVIIAAQETVSHNAANYVTFYGTKLVDAPSYVPYGWSIGNVYVTPGSGTVNNYDPGSIDTTPGYLVQPTAALTLTGIVAPQNATRLVLWVNYSVYTITLKHDNAGSTAANRFYTPNSADLVVQSYGAVFLLYNDVDSRWHVMVNNN